MQNGRQTICSSAMKPGGKVSKIANGGKLATMADKMI